MSAQFVPLQAGSGFPIPMQQPILLVGRHPEADVRVDSPLISRRHCCLAVVNNRVLIRDLGSRHGIHVNGVRVEEAEVREGDEVAIAHLIYRFEAGPTKLPPNQPVRPEPVESNANLPPLVDDFDDELVPLDD